VGAGIAFAGSLAAFSLSRSLLLSLVLLFLMGFLLIAFSTLVTTLLQSTAPQQLRGRVMSVYALGWQGLEYVGVMAIGGLATVWTAPPAVLGAATMVGLALLVSALVRGELLRLE